MKSTPSSRRPAESRSPFPRTARGGFALALLATALGCGERAPAPAPAAAAPSGATKPSVLLVTVDTLRADHLSSWGYPRLTSPVVDSLAREGVRFASAWSQWPKTGPSFTSMFTSTYPKDNGNVRQVGLPTSCEFRMLAEELQRAGYATRAVVANGALSRDFRYDQGFDEYVQTWQDAGEMTHLERTGATRVTDLALAAAAGLDPARPWFLWVHYVDPHTPYSPPPPYRDRFQGDEWFDPARRLRVFPQKAHEMGGIGQKQSLGDDRLAFYVARYDAEIAYADAEIGRLLEGLRARGMMRNTLTAFTSDHGESLGEHDYHFGHGRFAFETCLHVPLLFHWPGRLGPRVDERPAALVDLAPTLLDVAGVRLRDGRWAQGRSLGPRLRGDAPADEDAVVFAEGGTARDRRWIRVARDGRFKLHHAPLKGQQRWIAGEGTEFVLYDLEADPGETVNVADRHPEVMERLRGRLLAWWEAPRFDCKLDDQPCVEGARPVEAETTEQLRALGYL